MDKFTPGPWSYSAKLSGSENHKGFHIRGPRFEIVNGVYPLDEDGKEGEANARLLAVAPKLLAALRVAVENNERFVGRGLALAAISEATGEA